MNSPEPEAEYLRSLVLTAVRGGDAAPAPRGLRWERFEQLVRMHRVAPLVDRPLRASQGAEERAVRAVSEAARHLRLRGGLLRLELGRVVRALAAQGVEPIVLKGAALALLVYADPGQRVFSDLDLLVGHENVEPAIRALAPLGYAATGSEREAALWERHHFHRVLKGPWGARLELHWDLTRPRSYMRFDLVGFRARSRVVEADGVRLRVPDDGDQLLHAASQAVKEGFCDLRRIVDTALIVAGGGSVPSDLADRARTQGLAPALWLQLEIARELLGAQAPTSLLADLRPRGLRRRCLESLDPAVHTIEAFAERRSGYRHLLRWLCSPNLRVAATGMGRYLVPGVEEILADAEADGFFPETASRAVTTVRRAGSQARLLAWLSWRLLAHRGSHASQP